MLTLTNESTCAISMFTEMTSKFKQWLAKYCWPIQKSQSVPQYEHLVSVGEPLFIECDPTSPIEIPIRPRHTHPGGSPFHWARPSNSSNPYRSLSYTTASEARRALARVSSSPRLSE